MPSLSSLIVRGAIAQRPNFGAAGRIFIASDTGAQYYDTGTAWEQFAAPSEFIQRGTFADRPAFGIAGRIYISSDTAEQFYDTGSAWVAFGAAAAPTIPDVNASFALGTAGDEHGLFFNIGNLRRTTSWTNPYLAGRINICRTNDWGGSPSQLVNHDATNDNVSQNAGANNYFAIDLKTYRLNPDTYILRQRDSGGGIGGFPRNWALQATDSVPGTFNVANCDLATWTTIDYHKNNETITADNQWVVCRPQPTKLWRYFRILQHGPSDGGYFYMTWSEIEMYGVASGF